MYDKAPGIPAPIPMLVSSLAAFNCLYYCEMAVANYNQHLVLGRPNAVKKTSAAPGGEVPLQKSPSHPLIEEPENAEKHKQRWAELTQKQWKGFVKRMGS